MKKLILIATFVLMVVMINFNCTREYISYTPVCYSTEIQPIIAANCTGSGCHNATDKEANRDYSTYEGILKDVNPGNYLASKLYQVIIKTSGQEAMPPFPADRLSDATIKTIATWIEEGASNDTCSTSNNCDTTIVISYTNHVKPILSTYCAGSGCHSGNSPANDISYSTYTTTIPSVNSGQLLGSIRHDVGYSEMPKNSNQLSACNIAIIQKWISTGAPNN